MSFDVAAQAYDRFMGRFSRPLAAPFLALAGVLAGQRVLDVGCGPGALTEVLVAKVGSQAVSAIDPSESFVAAARERLPGVDVRRGEAEELPYPAGTFDVALAQLVVHFMTDPERGISEMARVTRPGGAVAACVWDQGVGPLATFWQAVRDLDPDAPNEAERPGTREGQLLALFKNAGLQDVEHSMLTVRVNFASFHEWWEPFTFGVGPAGSHVAKLSPQGVRELREHCAELLERGPFTLEASAWSALGRVVS